jgi:transposase-like protein
MWATPRPGPSEEVRGATGKGPGQGNKRFSARRKVEIVLGLLRGDDLAMLSRELGVTAARLSRWRAQFLSAGRVLNSQVQPALNSPVK